MNRSIVFRIVGGLLLVALLAAGGTFAYRAGVAQGISQAPEVAQAIQRSAENGNPGPMFNHGYGPGYPAHHGFGFGPRFGFLPLGLCFSAFFLFFFFGLLRFTFRSGGWRGHRGCGQGWEHGIHPKFDEWHKQAHAEEGGQAGK
ncbi:MAG: hypothetical protein IT310_04130 [Anaerolineales bacterium]|nr:hypothetical protein [Anaerolineales bacterium]